MKRIFVFIVITWGLLAAISVQVIVANLPHETPNDMCYNASGK